MSQFVKKDWTPPTVALVGAGPGEPGLITVAGLDRLRRADVVVFDALANPSLLQEARPHALQIDVGKRAGQHKKTQDAINALLVEHARTGRRVVRLKGGDPLLFGRGGEEAAYLAEHGIACEVIPGITSGLAAPAAAGIPPTHRGLASSVTLVTGHEEPDKTDTAVDYAALARLAQRGGTLCFYMGVARVDAIAAALIAQGLAPDTPAALVQWGTLPSQRTAQATLATLTHAVAQGGLSSPAIIVVGPVAGLRLPGLDSLTRRPLVAKRVLITRTRSQASSLRALLEERGAEVLEAPTIEMHPPESWEPIDLAIQNLTQWGWLVLTSRNAVDVLADRLEVLGLDARAVGGVKVAAVGQATAARLRERVGLLADLVPDFASGEALARTLILAIGQRPSPDTSTPPLADTKLLLLRADIAQPTLPQMLRKAGGEVEEVAAYQTRIVERLPDHVIQAIMEEDLDYVTFTSSSTVRNLVALMGDEARRLHGFRLASIGPATSRTLGELGFEVGVEASQPGVEPLVAALARDAGGA